MFLPPSGGVPGGVGGGGLDEGVGIFGVTPLGLFGGDDDDEDDEDDDDDEDDVRSRPPPVPDATLAAGRRTLVFPDSMMPLKASK
jgi:hypothetical protein